MPTPTPVYSLILWQKVSSLTLGLHLRLVFSHSVLVLVHQTHLLLPIHPPSLLRPHVLPLPPRPLTPPTLVLIIPHILVLKPPIPHDLFGPPSMVLATIVANGVTNSITATPPPEVLASDRALIFLLSPDPLLLIDPTFTSHPLVPTASLKSIRGTLFVAPLIASNTASKPIAPTLRVTIDVTSVLAVQLTSVPPLIATRVHLPVTMNLTLTLTLTSMEISRVLWTTLG